VIPPETEKGRRDGLTPEQVVVLASLGYCECDLGFCRLTTAERYRKRATCRYRHGSVKPIEKLNKAAANMVLGGPPEGHRRDG
jgi:hypothetical protein